ncbi:hypothetical protein CR513_09270, partial [Mucuna pruriens]
MVTLFINALPSPYYDRVVGDTTSSFTDLVVVGERIDLGIRCKKPAQTNSNEGFIKKSTLEKKKGKTNIIMIKPIYSQGKGVVSSYLAQYANPPPVPYVPPYQPRTNAGVVNPNPIQQDIRRLPRTLTPIPMTYKELLSQLLEQKLVKITPLKPLKPPYPRSYDPGAWCDYHSGAVGHTTEKCWSLKHKVQDLLDGGQLRFQDHGPNAQRNPLLTHKNR